MVRIALKITFLKLRYPKGVTERVFLSRIMALEAENSKKKKKDVIENEGKHQKQRTGNGKKQSNTSQRMQLRVNRVT